MLKRNHGERIMIGDDIIITMIKRPDGTFRIGIDAPRHLPIIREELLHKIATIQNGELNHA